MQESQSKSWWIDETRARIFNANIQEHILSLNVVYLINGLPNSCWISGFLVYTKKLLIWLTAGHVLKSLDEFLQNNKIGGVKTRWFDNCPKKDAPFIPCDYSSLLKTPIDIEGYDFGIVILRKIYADQILNVKENKPLTEIHWKLNDGFKAEGYYLVGLPTEFTKLDQTSSSSGGLEVRASSTLVSVPLTEEGRVIHQSDGDFWQHENNFYGQVHPIRNDDKSLLTDISGMSGGPIFGVRRIDEDRFEYRIIAIQSSWFQKKFIRGTRFDKVIGILNRALENTLAQNRGQVP
jgi:hypothetical protein